MAVQRLSSVIGPTWVVLFSIGCAVHMVLAQNILGVTVPTKLGLVRGTESESRDARTFYSFRGIPYAEPPVGVFRFEPPVPKQPWTGVLDASSYAPKCAQIDLLYDNFQGEEDCLYLNVFVPKIDLSDQELPVMFAIHGGYYAGGEGRDTSPDYFMDENMILVTPNYRLNILGFLNMGDGTVRGNMGLKDLTLALKWTYENIKYFGGDPEKITLQGGSAGAALAHMMLISNSSREFIHKLILQSGSALSPWSLQRNPRPHAIDYAKRIGCLRNSTVGIVACMKSLNVETLLDQLKGTSGINSGQNWDFDKIFTPTIEKVITNDTFLPEEPLVLLKDGQFKPVPVFISTNSGESLINLLFYNQPSFSSQLRHPDKNFWLRFAKQHMYLELKADKGPEIQRLAEAYLGKPPLDPSSPSTFQRLVKFVSDRNFYFAQQETIRVHASSAPVYAIHYNKSSPLSVYDMMRSIPSIPRVPRAFSFGLGMAGMMYNRLVLRRSPRFHGVSHGDDIMMYTPLRGLFSMAYRFSRDYKFSKNYVKLLSDFVTDRKVLAFQGIKVPEVDLSHEFRYLIVNDYPNSRIGTVPFKSGYLAWKMFLQRVGSYD